MLVVVQGHLHLLLEHAIHLNQTADYRPNSGIFFYQKNILPKMHKGPLLRAYHIQQTGRINHLYVPYHVGIFTHTYIKEWAVQSRNLILQART